MTTRSPERFASTLAYTQDEIMEEFWVRFAYRSPTDTVAEEICRWCEARGWSALVAMTGSHMSISLYPSRARLTMRAKVI